jgi:hypothetical protein
MSFFPKASTRSRISPMPPRQKAIHESGKRVHSSANIDRRKVNLSKKMFSLDMD